MSRKKSSAPAPTEFRVDDDRGTSHFSKYISKATGRVSGIVVDPFNFLACPICLEPDPDFAEHVPPRSLGGRVMTRTCRPCNNDFGTAEEELRRFLELEVTIHAESPDGVVKGRRAATVALRSSEGRPPGAFVRTSSPDFDDVLNSGGSKLTIKPLNMALVIAAALKHSYLAACLHQQEIPTSDDVRRVRAVLLAARDRDQIALVTRLSEIENLTTPGWIEAASPPTLLLLETCDDEPGWIFALAGRFALRWPFADVPPRAQSLGRPGAGDENSGDDPPGS